MSSSKKAAPEPCRSQGLAAEGISCAASPERQHQKRRVSSIMGEEAPGFSWHREGAVGAGEERAVCKALSPEDAGLSPSPSSCSVSCFPLIAGPGRSWVPPPPQGKATAPGQPGRAHRDPAPGTALAEGITPQFSSSPPLLPPAAPPHCHSLGTTAGSTKRTSSTTKVHLSPSQFILFHVCLTDISPQNNGFCSHVRMWVFISKMG